MYARKTWTPVSVRQVAARQDFADALASFLLPLKTPLSSLMNHFQQSVSKPIHCDRCGKLQRALLLRYRVRVDELLNRRIKPPIVCEELFLRSKNLVN